MTDRTFNNKTKSNLSKAYFYETRVIGRIPKVSNSSSAKISSSTVEVFIAFDDREYEPTVTFTADHNAPDSMTVKVLQPIDPQDFAALCEHYTHDFVKNEGQTMADEYQMEMAPYQGPDINENGLKVYAGDLCEVN